MISPDAAADLRAERRFDLATALLIGVIAMLAALLAVVQIHYNQESTRADAQAARLSADLSARLSASSVAFNSILAMQQEAVAFNIEALSRAIAGLDFEDKGAVAVAVAEQEAAKSLLAAVGATAATMGGKPLDAYAAGLVESSIMAQVAEVREQNRQVDLANKAGSLEQKAVLALSFLALGGILTGLGAVLNEGRAGWISLLVAAAMTALAGAMAVLAVV